jgi:gamma-glutamyltranspeptidase/glutathione hydrolase
MDCVVEPAMNGIGGEGVMAIHLAKGENVIVDYVGRPSKDCRPDMYELTDCMEPGWMGWRGRGDANVRSQGTRFPGQPWATEALERYGTVRLLRSWLPPSRRRGGFPVGWWTAAHIFQGMKTFWHLPEWKRTFLHDSQFPYLPFTYDLQKPEMFVQANLAKSLRAISEGGRDAFYKGWIADAIADEMAKNDGLINREDLAMYEP